MSVFGKIRTLFARLDPTGIKALDSSMDKFRSLRDDYRLANREYFGDYLFTILDQK